MNNECHKNHKIQFDSFQFLELVHLSQTLQMIDTALAEAGEDVLKIEREYRAAKKYMEYAIESSTNVQDEILQRELAHTSDEKMKSIISTIQREQNVIIRNESADTLIIQGVAGSGKTSIGE